MILRELQFQLFVLVENCGCFQSAGNESDIFNETPCYISRKVKTWKSVYTSPRVGKAKLGGHLFNSRVLSGFQLVTQRLVVIRNDDRK